MKTVHRLDKKAIMYLLIYAVYSRYNTFHSYSIYLTALCLVLLEMNIILQCTITYIVHRTDQSDLDIPTRKLLQHGNTGKYYTGHPI